MGYKNKFGYTKIKSKQINNFIISWDYNTTPKSKFPVFLFTPDMDDTNNHYHIKLDKTQARKTDY
jgi:hypothetical protein